MKNYQIWTENMKGAPLQLEYEIYADGEYTRIHYSNDESWSDHVKGQEVGQMHNTGDGLEVTLVGVKGKIKLDYMQAHQLLSLLISDTLEYKTEIRESKTIKQF